MNVFCLLFVAFVFATVEDDRDVSDDNYLFDEVDDVNFLHSPKETIEDRLQLMKKEGMGHCASSKRKSPIDIDLKTASLVSLPPLKFDHYDESEHVLERIQKHTFFTSIAGFANWTKPPVLSGGPLDGNYHLMEVNWNMNMNAILSLGSNCLPEPFYGHTINNAQHSAELHFVHTKDGLPVYEAQKYSDGIVIVSVFLDVTHKFNKPMNNTHFLEQRVKYAIHETPGTEFQWVSPNHFLPKDRDAFFVYEGSFSHPPCNSDVTWIILLEPLSWSPIEKNFPVSQQRNAGHEHYPVLRKKTNPNVLYNNPKMTQNIRMEPQTSTSVGAILVTVIITLIVVGLCFAAFKFIQKKGINWNDADGKSDIGFVQFQ